MKYLKSWAEKPHFSICCCTKDRIEALAIWYLAKAAQSLEVPLGCAEPVETVENGMTWLRRAI